MNTRYDVAILGCGEAGIFAGYELMHRSPGLKVVTLDQGADIYTRSCPIVAGKVKECIHCKVCDTMCGFGGAGAFSDGKYNFTTAFGGWLTDFMPKKEVMELIDYVDSINMKHGATDQVYSTETPEARALEKKALEYDLHLLQARCKHLGTENNLRILQSIYEEVRQGIEFRFRTQVVKIENLGKEGYRLITDKGDEVDCTWLIAAPGRSGAEWFHRRGVRVQAGLPHQAVRRPGAHLLHEPLRPRGGRERGGHQHRQRPLLLRPQAEKREHQLRPAGVQPLYPALQRALPLRQAHRLPVQHAGRRRAGAAVRRPGEGRAHQRAPHEQVLHPYQLDKLAPGTANYDTLLYGAEVKFYSARLALSSELETALPGFFAAGDGAGITRGLAQAGASGVKVAQVILNRLK